VHAGLVADDCRACLNQILKVQIKFFSGRQGGRIMGLRCSYRFELYPLFSGRTLLHLPAPAPTTAPGPGGTPSVGEGEFQFQDFSLKRKRNKIPTSKFRKRYFVDILRFTGTIDFFLGTKIQITSPKYSESSDNPLNYFLVHFTPNSWFSLPLNMICLFCFSIHKWNFNFRFCKIITDNIRHVKNIS
jgi:hypothetical protein